MSTTTNNLGISQNGIPIYDNAVGTFSNTIPPSDQVLVGDANSQIIGIDPTGFDVGNPLCTTGVGTPPNYSATPTVDSITILNPPNASTDGTNKAYVDSVAGGLKFINAADLATTANLNATYANGVAGVGATLTNAGAQVALSIDSTACVVGDRILVKNQTAEEENGVYEVTDIGSGATNWEMERTTDYDQITEIVPGSIVPVNFGATNANTYWLETETVAVIGTDPICFLPFANLPSGVLLAANNLSDVASAATSRSNLGLTAVATQTPTQYAVQVGGAANALVSLALGTAGQVLTSNGAGANPSFQSVSSPFITCNFSAYLNSAATNATGNGAVYTLSGLTELFDAGTNFDPTTGVFTVPQTGKYCLSAGIAVSNLTVAMNDCVIKIRNTTAGEDIAILSAGNPYARAGATTLKDVCSASTIVQLTASDQITVTVQINNGAGNTATVNDGKGYSYFAGYILGV